MLLIVLSFIAASLLLTIGFVLGYLFRDIHDWIHKTTLYMVNKLQPKPEPPKPQGTGAVIVDPDDLIQRAKFERDEMTRRINE